MKYALIGKSLSHSYSKQFFTDKFLLNQNSVDSYHNLEFSCFEDLTSAFETIKTTYRGLNVTIPYKESIIELLDELSMEAEAIGAVNCIVIDNAKAKGYNTDALGFFDSIKHLLRPNVKKALILGSGGASKAIQYALSHWGKMECTVVSNTNESLMNYSNINKEIINDHPLIVNTTPVGMFPMKELFPKIPYKYLFNKHICIDLIYNPNETKFLKKSRYKGG